MAKYQLIIEADDEDDLVGGVSRLAALLGGVADVSAPAAEGPKRGRPRKDAAASGTNASGDQGSAAQSQTAPGSDTGQTATSTASPSSTTAADLLGDGGGAATVTRETVVAKITEGIDKLGAEAAKNALEAKGLSGQLSKIPPEKYAEAVTIIDGAIALG